MYFKALLFALAVLVATCNAKTTDYVEEYKLALIAQGATPEQLELFDTLFVNNTRPTLVCLCHHEAPLKTCGINGKQYLNQCSTRCAHVNAACVGNGCGDCVQYNSTDPCALQYSLDYNGTVYKSNPSPRPATHHDRKLLTLR